MALAHVSLPIYAVRLHPESILSLKKGLGTKIIPNVMKQVTMQRCCLRTECK